MTDTPQPKDLEAILAQLEQNWQELAELLRTQGRQLRGKVIEAEKFVLVDARGEPRGKLEAKEDGSSALVLLDRDGNYRAWLGLKEDGTGYLTLKDRFGRICWEAPPEPRQSAAAAPAGFPWEAESVSRETPEVMERLEKLSADLAALKELLPSRGRTEDREPEPEPAAPEVKPQETEAGPGFLVGRRLDQLERQHGRLKIWSSLLTAVLLVALAGLGFTLAKVLPLTQVAPKPGGEVAAPAPGGEVKAPAPGGELLARALTIQDPDGGASRAWLGPRDGGLYLDLMDGEGKIRTTLGLDKAGDPSLKLYDQSHNLRAELALSPAGEPGLSLVDAAGLLRVALGGINPGFQVPEELQERPLSSLVLFNQDGVPVWRAPLRWRR